MLHTATCGSSSEVLKSHNLRNNFGHIINYNVNYFKSNVLKPENGVVRSNSGNRIVIILDMDAVSVHECYQAKFSNVGH